MAIKTRTLEIGLLTRAIPGESEADCGDVGLVLERDDGYLLGMIDGLGHGSKASRIAQQARAAIEARAPDEPIQRIMSGLVEAFQGSRGFVAALFRVDAESDTLEYCGIGNIRARLFDDAERTLLTNEGIVGQFSARPETRRATFRPGATLMIHTDGISSHLHAGDLARTLEGDAQAAAERVIAQYARDTDDAGVLVVRRPA